MALLTTEDVLEKTFNIVKFREGYDQVEVDDFLDEVVSTIYTLQAENQNLREQLEAAERRVAELSGGEAPSYKPAEETAAPVVEEPVASEPSVTETAVAATGTARPRRVRPRWSRRIRSHHRRRKRKARRNYC